MSANGEGFCQEAATATAEIPGRDGAFPRFRGDSKGAGRVHLIADARISRPVLHKDRRLHDLSCIDILQIADRAQI